LKSFTSDVWSINASGDRLATLDTAIGAGSWIITFGAITVSTTLLTICISEPKNVHAG
jgi:hypothetical protein